jgi:ribonuclease VapC
MVIDSSALIAIALKESLFDMLAEAIEKDPVRIVGAPTALETSMVLVGRSGIDAETEFEQMLAVMGARVVPFGRDEVRIAARAFRLYGKGRHAAALNYGDCMAYAVSIAHGEPLLYKGNDFSLTDVRSAL